MRRSTSRGSGGWLALARDLALLGAESAEVMARRCLVLVRCDLQAAHEFGLMVEEKVVALAELQCAALSGRIGRNPRHAARVTLDHVRRKVRANRVRLRR